MQSHKMSSADSCPEELIADTEEKSIVVVIGRETPSIPAILHSIQKAKRQIIVTNDFTAVLFLRYCEQHDIHVPQDLLFATLKDNCVSRYCCPSLTSFAVDFQLIGKYAVVLW